jgi:hypothetical protein
MMIRILAAAALATLTVGAAQAGTLTNGAWTPTGCGTDPGNAPAMDSSNGGAYTKSTKAFQEWQDKAKAYVSCLAAEAKTDQNAVVEATNKVVQRVNDDSTNFVTQANAAVEKLKGKAKK